MLNMPTSISAVEGLSILFTVCSARPATAICFCAAAKSIVVGAPILSILYGGLSPQNRAILSIPLVLYQAEQVFVAQILVSMFKRWNAVEEPKNTLVEEPDIALDGKGSPAGFTGDGEISRKKSAV